jgi:L-iditol 2-dehydrogenase
MTLTNGSHNANGNGHAHAQVSSDALHRPNLALWVTKDHQYVASWVFCDQADDRIYQKEEAFPECPPDSCVIHVKATGICGS